MLKCARESAVIAQIRTWTFRGLPPAAPPWPAVPGVDDSGRLRAASEPRVAMPEPGVGRSRVRAPGWERGGENAPARRPLVHQVPVRQRPRDFPIYCSRTLPKLRAVLPGKAVPMCPRQRRGPRPPLLEATCRWVYGSLPKTPGRLRGFHFGP